MGAGKFAEAERLIDEMPEGQRQSSYIYLANNIYQQNPAENKSRAVAVLEKAHALISEKPENQTEMSQLMQIIAAYSNIETTKAFLLFEALIPQLNELADAAVVLNGFQGGSNIRQGEFVMAQGVSHGFYGADFSVFRAFLKNDFDRAMNLADGFTRREIRIALKLQLAENILD
jgi:predicted deacetylase